MVIVDISDVGRDRARSIAMIVLCVIRVVEWNAAYGDDEDGARART